MKNIRSERTRKMFFQLFKIFRVGGKFQFFAEELVCISIPSRFILISHQWSQTGGIVIHSIRYALKNEMNTFGMNFLFSTQNMPKLFIPTVIMPLSVLLKCSKKQENLNQSSERRMFRFLMFFFLRPTMEIVRSCMNGLILV